MAADAAAGWFRLSSGSFRVRGAVFSQSTFPLVRSSAIVSSASSRRPVRKILFSKMIGDEKPWGSCVFQITFLSGPNSAGRPFVCDTPDPFGPRNRDQSVSVAAVTAIIASTRLSQVIRYSGKEDAQVGRILLEVSQSGRTL